MCISYKSPYDTSHAEKRTSQSVSLRASTWLTFKSRGMYGMAWGEVETRGHAVRNLVTREVTGSGSGTTGHPEAARQAAEGV